MFKVDFRQMWFRIILLTFGLFLGVLNLAGTERAALNNYSSYNISVLSGLPNNNVDGLITDNKGFVWISTYGGGMARFDGQNFVCIDASHGLISSDYVTESCYDDYDRLWVGSAGGVDVIDMRTLKKSDLSAYVETVANGRFCNYILKDSQGKIWFDANNILFRVSFDSNGRISRLDSLVCDDADQRLYLKYADIDKDGLVWLAVNNQLLKVTYSEDYGMSSSPIYDLDLSEESRITAMMRTGHEVWVGSDAGLYRMDYSTGEYKLYVADASKPGTLVGNQITDIECTDDGRIFVGTLNGVNLYNPIADDFYSFTSENDEYGGRYIFDDVVRSLMASGDKLYVGTELEGITILVPGRLTVKNLHYANATDDFPAGPVDAICFDSKSRLWFGTPIQGLYFERGVGFNNFNRMNSGLTDDAISAMAVDGAGKIWVGMRNGGLNIVNSDGPTVFKTLRSSISGRDDGLDNISFMLYDETRNFMWICSRSGLYWYDLLDYRLHKYEDIRFRCLSVCLGHDDILYVGGSSVLVKINTRTKEMQMYKLPSDVFSIDIDSEGRIWAGTSIHGLFMFAPDGSMKKFTVCDGLSDDKVRAVKVVGNRLWVASENGLSSVNLISLEIDSFGLKDGLSSVGFCSNAIAADTVGRIYLGHMHGMSIVSPDSIIPQTDTVRSDVRLIRGLAGEHEINLAYSNFIHMYERDRALSFEFADLVFGNSEFNIRYFYRIFPLDDEWREVRGASRFVRYDYPSGGKYVLQIRSCDPSGAVLSEDERALIVTPRFYKTWWFMIFLAMLAVILLIVITNFRTRSIQRQKEILRLEVQRQTRELAEQNSRLEKQAAELVEQNKRLLRLNEELAGHKMVFNSGMISVHSSKDEEFASLLMSRIKDLYKDPSVDTEMICQAMGMCRSVLNSRIHETFGMSIGQFLRTYRLNIAREILSGSKARDVNVSEVAYDVGFNDPKYFTRCFTREFKVTPSSLLRPDDEGAGK